MFQGIGVTVPAANEEKTDGLVIEELIENKIEENWKVQAEMNSVLKVMMLVDFDLMSVHLLLAILNPAVLIAVLFAMVLSALSLPSRLYHL